MPAGRGAAAVAEGGLLAGITVVLLLLASLLPFGMVLRLAAPLPAALLYVRRGWRPAAVCIAASSLLLGAFFGLTTAAGAAVTLAGVALPLGWTQRRRLALLPALLLTAVCDWLAMACLLGATSLLFARSPFGGARLQLAAALDRVARLLPLVAARLGLAPGTTATALSWLAAARDRLPLLAPLTLAALLAGIAAVQAVCAYAALRPLLRRTGHEPPGLPLWVQRPLDRLRRLG